MERLTERSKNSDMVWFNDPENGGMRLEPCEMSAHHNRMAITKLADYEDAEEQGLLLRLPCKIGDAVWEYSCFGLMEYKVARVGFDKSGDLYFDCNCGIAYSFRCYIKNFGKTVFLTKEEAETKLKELEDSYYSSLQMLHKRE